MSKPGHTISMLAAGLLSITLIIGIYTLVRHRKQSRSNLLTTTYAIAPDFVLKDLNGGTVELSKFRGKVVILDYWATWCAPCKIEIPRLMQLQEKYSSQGLQVLGISMDDGPEPVRIFTRELRLNYPIALGDVKVAEDYGGILGLPVVFLIDRQGRIRQKMVGEGEMQSMEGNLSALLGRP